MKKLSMALFLLFSVAQWCGAEADFGVTNIFSGNDGFIRIELKNKSSLSLSRMNQCKEKVILVFFLNHTRRAEYKVKSIPASFFLNPGKTTIVTHFREAAPVLARADINLAPVFPESRKEDNSLEKRLRHD